MKNKKLFAILTLVCFMFTLMPVAAFAADPYVWVEEDAEVVKLDAATGGKADVRFQLSGTGSEIYVFAMKGGVLSEKVFAGTQKGFIKLNANPVSDAMTLTFTEQGEYTVYVVNADAYAKGVVAEATANNSGTAAKSLTQAANELLANSDNKAVMENNVITVNPYTTSYALSASINGSTFYAEGTEDYKNIVEAALNPSSNGADEKTVWVKLTNNNVGVSGQDLTVTTNSYGIETSRETVTTNPNGVAKFKVSSTIAGDFKVYVEYGAKADLTLNVESDATAAAYITTVYAPTAPVALDTAIHDSEIAFTISDINGNNVDTLAKVDNNGDANYTVKLVESPKGTSIKATNLALGYDADSATWYLQGADLDAEGTYTFKVVLANGHSATATIAVKEFQTPVELKMVYKQNAVELDGTALLHKLFYVDANGVTKSLITKENSVFKNDKGETIKVNGVKNVKLAANGYAIDNFYANAYKGYDESKSGNFTAGVDKAAVAAGTVEVKADEKYVGSKITVVAVDTKYNLTATADLVVANEAASVKYANPEVEVGVNNTLVGNIVDADGNKVALNNVVGDASISYVVLGTPSENAKVAVSTKVAGNLASKGEFKTSFTASEIGKYELQTIVTYEQADGVIKYYSGIETITVGNAGIDDVVVMSVGSNEIVKNGKVAVIDAAPVIENNRTFVPFRALAEAFGATVAFDEATQAVTAELNGTTVVMTIGSATYTVNGAEETADVAPFINGSRTMVPVRFVAQAFGITVTPTYDDNGATADILFAK